MARVDGVDGKTAAISLTYIHGIGRSSAEAILDKAGIEKARKVGDLSEKELDVIRKLVDSEYTVEGSLRALTRMNVKRLMDIGCYRGLRHRRGLPVRGQKTRTNARGRKGPRRTVANKKKATK